eukprot:848472-Prorocentrum_minimum.AAC.1
MTSFYGSSFANNGKDALNTPEARDVGRYMETLRTLEMDWPGISLSALPGGTGGRNGESSSLVGVMLNVCARRAPPAGQAPESTVASQWQSVGREYTSSVRRNIRNAVR